MPSLTGSGASVHAAPGGPGRLQGRQRLPRPPLRRRVAAARRAAAAAGGAGRGRGGTDRRRRVAAARRAPAAAGGGGGGRGGAGRGGRGCPASPPRGREPVVPPCPG